MFKIYPNAKFKWKHVWIVSLVTAFLFEIGKFCLGLYFGKLKHGAGYGVGYGSAQSIIIILLWVSCYSMIVFYGAEFTDSYANLYSGKVPPTEIAKKCIGNAI
jgi:membrane protein